MAASFGAPFSKPVTETTRPAVDGISRLSSAHCGFTCTPKLPAIGPEPVAWKP